MGNTDSKLRRMKEINSLLLIHAEGLSQSEIAKKLGVHRSTIGRYIPDLPPYIYIDEEDNRKLKIDRNADIIQIHLNIHEATAIHLATRLLATRMDKQNPHAASALHKLSISLDKISPHISDQMKISANEITNESQIKSEVFLKSLEDITISWAESRKLKIWHSIGKGHHLREYLFSPYFIEPYAIGQTTYVIGFCEPQDAIRSLRLEKIQRTQLTRIPYTIPPTFDSQQLLQDAWGIWFTNKPPIKVRLQFSSAVAERILQTQWHKSETLIKQDDGSLIWSASIAEPKEMVPWIKGWGSSCKVLEPDSLIEMIVADVKNLVELYEGEG